MGNSDYSIMTIECFLQPSDPYSYYYNFLFLNLKSIHMKTLVQLKRQVVLVLFVLPIACSVLSQTPPSQWDTLPWKSYADFKLQLLNKSYVTTGILYDRVFPTSQLDEHSGLPSSNNDTVTDERFLQAYYEIYNS